MYSLLTAGVAIASSGFMVQPSEVRIVETTLAFGRIQEQTALKQVPLAEKAIRLEAGTDSKRREAYLFFPMRSDEPGRLALRIWSSGNGAWLELSGAELKLDRTALTFDLNVQGKGSLEFDVLWTRRTDLTPFLRVDATGKSAIYHQIDATPLPVLPAPARLEVAASPAHHEIQLEREAMNWIRAVDYCHEALDGLTLEMGTKSAPYVWDETKVTIDAIAEACADENRDGPLYVRIEPDSGAVFGIGPADFKPLVTRHVAIRDPSGKLRAAEVILFSEP